MDGRVVIVIGASRGIGQALAENLAAAGLSVVLAARSTQLTHPSSSDNIDNISSIINAKGGKSVAMYCDVLKVDSLAALIEQTMSKFGRIDALMYNSGAIWWSRVEDTPLKRFDLLHNVNFRGLYAAVQKLLPIFSQQGHGRLIAIAPPIYSRFIKGKTAYAASKFGMTTLCLGLAHEYQGTGMVFCTLWPSTAIKSAVTDKLQTDPKLLREPSIFADACMQILNADCADVNGRTLIDEDFLRERGVTDFAKYQVVAGLEPPRMMPKVFPTLTVPEESEQLFIGVRSKL